MPVEAQFVLGIRREGCAERDYNDNRGILELDEIAETTLRRCELNDKALRSLDISNALFASFFFSQLSLALRHNTTLRELYLDNCGVDDEALRVLSKGVEQNGGSALRVLSLEDNNVRCLGASHVAKVLRGHSRWARSFGGYRTHAIGAGKGLQYLSFKGNAVSSIGSKAIAEALMTSDDSLERVSLEANRINDWGAGWFALALRNHNVLQCLDLHRNPIGNDGVEELKAACETARASLVLLRKVLRSKTSTPSDADSEGKITSSASDSDVEQPEEMEEEQCVQLVTGQRLTTVYVSEPSNGGTESNPNSGRSTARRKGAYARPGSASRRQGFSVQRHNGQLNIEEPGGAVMVDSAPADSNGAGSAEAGRPSAPLARPTKVSLAALTCSGPTTKRAAPVRASTYMVAATEVDARRHARVHPGERAMGVEEMETATTLVPPSRWRRKLVEHPPAKRQFPSMGGCGASAAKGLKRCQSAPSRRCGMLLGPHAASGVYGWCPCV